MYFPTTAIISLLHVMENGDSAEIAVVGNDGLVAVSMFIGGGSTPSRAVVQSAGHGFRLKAKDMKQEFDRCGAASAAAAAELGLAGRYRFGDDARVDCQHAGCAA